MAMPRKLKLMNVFLNGYSYQGVAKSVTLPKLTRKLENYRGAGMNGSAPVDLGLDDDALSMEWSLGGFPDSVIWELYAATGVDAVLIRFAGLPARRYRRNGGRRSGHAWTSKEIDTGEGKQGEDTESKISVVCTYFRLTMDGKELVEIDTINMIEKVNGVDRLEQHRRNIGL